MQRTASPADERVLQSNLGPPGAGRMRTTHEDRVDRAQALARFVRFAASILVETWRVERDRRESDAPPACRSQKPAGSGVRGDEGVGSGSKNGPSGSRPLDERRVDRFVL